MDLGSVSLPQGLTPAAQQDDGQVAVRIDDGGQEAGQQVQLEGPESGELPSVSFDDAEEQIGSGIVDSRVIFPEETTTATTITTTTTTPTTTTTTTLKTTTTTSPPTTTTTTQTTTTTTSASQSQASGRSSSSAKVPLWLQILRGNNNRNNNNQRQAKSMPLKKEQPINSVLIQKIIQFLGQELFYDEIVSDTDREFPFFWQQFYPYPDDEVEIAASS